MRISISDVRKPQVEVESGGLIYGFSGYRFYLCSRCRIRARVDADLHIPPHFKPGSMLWKSPVGFLNGTETLIAWKTSPASERIRNSTIWPTFIPRPLIQQSHPRRMLSTCHQRVRGEFRHSSLIDSSKKKTTTKKVV